MFGRLIKHYYYYVCLLQDPRQADVITRSSIMETVAHLKIMFGDNLCGKQCKLTNNIQQTFQLQFYAVSTEMRPGDLDNCYLVSVLAINDFLKTNGFINQTQTVCRVESRSNSRYHRHICITFSKHGFPNLQARFSNLHACPCLQARYFRPCRLATIHNATDRETTDRAMRKGRLCYSIGGPKLISYFPIESQLCSNS